MSGLQQQLAALKHEYLSELPDIAQRLRRALLEQDLHTLRHDTHKLAGNAAAFEQIDIAHLASELDAVFSQLLEQERSADLTQHKAAVQRLIEMLENIRT